MKFNIDCLLISITATTRLLYRINGKNDIMTYFDGLGYILIVTIRSNREEKITFYHRENNNH